MAYVQLTNQLGTGRPELKMRLVAYGDDKWPHPKGPPWYEIKYRSQNFIPGSTQGDKEWSAWNILDEQENYFGTITLHSSVLSGAVWFPTDFYKPPENNGRCSKWKEAPAPNLNYLDALLLTNDRAFSGVLIAQRVYADLHPPFPTDTPLATPAIRAYPRQPIVLSTNGASIIDDRGGTVILKGLNRPSLEWNVKGEYLSPLDIKTMSGWLGNVIRIPLNRDFWKASASRETKGSYKQIVDATIYYAIENDMAVILDNHVPQNSLPAKDAIDFWKDLAATYREFGTVLFDLHNECYDPDRTNKNQLNTPFTQIELNQWRDGYQMLLNAVREAGANNICLVGGLDYAYRLEFVNKDFCVKDTPNGNGIVYCSHLYNARGTDVTDDADSLTGHWYGPPVKDGRSPFDVNFAGVLDNFPVMITEFGCNQSLQYEPVIGCEGSPEDPPKPGICTAGKNKTKGS